MFKGTPFQKAEGVSFFRGTALSKLTDNMKGRFIMNRNELKGYYDLSKRNEVFESARKLRRQFLRYKDAEIVYSMSHRMLFQHASAAGAIYRMDGTVLINRDVFDAYLEQFREPAAESTKREEE